MTPLRKKMIEEMQLRRFSENTQESYIRSVTGLASHYRKSPDKISQEELKDYVLSLTNERSLKWATINTITAGIRFFYSETLGRKDMSLAIPARKTPKRLPQILSREELISLFESTANLKHRLVLVNRHHL